MNVMSRNLSLLTMLATAIAATVGCSQGEPKGDVLGEVRFDGQAIQVGMVLFEPADAATPPRHFTIENGTYRADGKSALRPGDYRVRITAPKPSQTNQQPTSPNAQVEYVPLLPPSWNTQSKLSVSVRPGKNTIHFQGKRGDEPSVEIGAGG